MDGVQEVRVGTGNRMGSRNLNSYRNGNVNENGRSTGSSNWYRSSMCIGNGMGTGSCNVYRKTEWVQEVVIGTGKWNEYKKWKVYKKLECVQENRMSTEIGSGTGSFNGCKKIEREELEWVQGNRMGIGSWNGYRKME